MLRNVSRFALQTSLWQDPPVTEARLRRISAVTRHYTTLRGSVSRAITVLVALAGAHGLYLVPDGRSYVAGAMALLSLFAAAALGILVMIRVERWMDGRFGRVRSGGELLRGPATVLALWGWIAGNYVDERYVLTSDAPSTVFLGSAAFGAWLLLTLGRYGSHNVLPTLVSFVAAMALAGVDDMASFETWKWNAYRATALAWFGAGLIDLGLIWKTLGRQAPSADGVADVS